MAQNGAKCEGYFTLSPMCYFAYGIFSKIMARAVRRIFPCRKQMSSQVLRLICMGKGGLRLPVSLYGGKNENYNYIEGHIAKAI